MFKRSAMLVALTVGLTGVACQQISPLTEEDIAAINSVGVALDEAALASDWGALAALLTEDAVFMLPNGPAVEGRAAIQGFIESMGLVITEHTFEFTHIEGQRDVAYGRASYTETFTVGDLATAIEDAGKGLALLRRQPDNSWLIAVWCWNSDLPVPTDGSGAEE
jgi:ketosteroid isomerase-like protein